MLSFARFSAIVASFTWRLCERRLLERLLEVLPFLVFFLFLLHPPHADGSWQTHLSYPLLLGDPVSVEHHLYIFYVFGEWCGLLAFWRYGLPSVIVFLFCFRVCAIIAPALRLRFFSLFGVFLFSEVCFFFSPMVSAQRAMISSPWAFGASLSPT